MARKSEADELPPAEHYTYRVAWNSVDEDFIATVAEFPSLSWVANTRPAALAGLTTMVEKVLIDMAEQGEEIPVPWDEREFSGKFNLRLGPALHRQVALEAAESGESLNSYVVKKLGGIPV